MNAVAALVSGRRGALALLAVPTSAVLAFLLWDLALDVPVFAAPGPRTLGYVLLLPVLGLLAAAWGLTSRAPSWEVRAPGRVRAMVAGWAVMTWAATVAVPFTVVRLVLHLPEAVVPRSDFRHDRFASMGGAGAWDPFVTNVAAVGAVALVAVALTGRVLGTFATLGCWYALMWSAGGGAAALLPYRIHHDSPVPFEPQWWTVGVGAVLVGAVWFRTTGATRLARRLDGRL